MKEKFIFDVLALGIVAVDDLLYVESYPVADAKTQVQRRDRQCGGLAATALVAAARLGSKCAYAGVLGVDALSDFAIERLNQEGIDTKYVVKKTHARPVHSTIIVDQHRKTRNIFFDIDGIMGPDLELPDPAIISSSRVLLVDHFGIKGMIRAAKIAQKAGVPIVADFEGITSADFHQLLALVDHLILSRDFAEQLTGLSDPSLAVAKLRKAGHSTVIVTCGGEGCWYSSDTQSNSVMQEPAFSVKVVDTTGCGDVFHGAYAAALAQEMPLVERIQFASAAAALKATQPGGQLGIPTRVDVDNFLKSQPVLSRG